MPRGRSDAAVAAAKAAKPAPKKRSVSANDEQARALAQRRKLAQAAAQSAFENGVGAKAALKMEEFKDQGLTYNMVHRSQGVRQERPRPGAA